MKKIIKKCKCGSKDFWLNEGLTWKEYVDENGILNCQNPTSGIETICCEKCGKEYSEENFKKINFG